MKTKKAYYLIIIVAVLYNLIAFLQNSASEKDMPKDQEQFESKTKLPIEVKTENLNQIHITNL